MLVSFSLVNSRVTNFDTTPPRVKPKWADVKERRTKKKKNVKQEAATIRRVQVIARATEVTERQKMAKCHGHRIIKRAKPDK